MEILIIWLLFCGLVGFAAQSKGRNAAGWFILAFLISPLIAGIAVLIAGPAKHAVAPLVSTNIGDELSKFAALRESGALSPDEFETQKARLLALTAAPPGPRPIGSRCGRCGKNLSPVWKAKCNHCGGTFADYAPVIAPAT